MASEIISDIIGIIVAAALWLWLSKTKVDRTGRGRAGGLSTG